jgi:hypothetical protein
MAAFVKFEDFVEQLGLAKHNLSTHQLMVCLGRSSAAAGAGNQPQVTDVSRGDFSEPTGTGYAAIDTLNTWAEASGTATLTGTKSVFTAGAGGWTSFRYVVLFNEDTTSPVDALIGMWDYTSDLVLAAGETFSVKYNNSDTTGSILTLA